MEKTLVNSEDGESKSFPKRDFSNEYERLKTLLRFQKRKVRKDMHRAMSPISAISGYLELMKMVLQNDADIERIEKYRTKIDEGIDELGDIIENLHDVFVEASESEAPDNDKSFVGLGMHRKAS